MAKKDKKAKLPKKVGGVKLPKQLRKSAKTALEIAQNPIAREVVSAALVAGAAALARRKAEKATPAAEAKGTTTATDLGNLIAQGVAAFVGGLGKPVEKKEDAEPKPAAQAPKPRPRPKSAP